MTNWRRDSSLMSRKQLKESLQRSETTPYSFESISSSWTRQSSSWRMWIPMAQSSCKIARLKALTSRKVSIKINAPSIQILRKQWSVITKISTAASLSRISNNSMMTQNRNVLRRRFSRWRIWMTVVRLKVLRRMCLAFVTRIRLYEKREMVTVKSLNQLYHSQARINFASYALKVASKIFKKLRLQKHNNRNLSLHRAKAHASGTRAVKCHASFKYLRLRQT